MLLIPSDFCYSYVKIFAIKTSKASEIITIIAKVSSTNINASNAAIVSLALGFFLSLSAISEYSCALDERLAGDSDGQQEKQLFDELRAPFSPQTLKCSSIFVLLEASAAANSACDDDFSAFIEKIFYVAWTEGIRNRQHEHLNDARQVCWLAPFKIPIKFFSRRPSSKNARILGVGQQRSYDRNGRSCARGSTTRRGSDDRRDR